MKHDSSLSIYFIIYIYIIVFLLTNILILNWKEKIRVCTTWLKLNLNTSLDSQMFNILK